MPWFVTAIHALQQAEGPSLYGEKPVKKIAARRCFGFFDRHVESFRAVSTNQGDMHEALYNFLVVEYIEGGIHPEVYHEEWYQWDEKSREWIMIPKPKDFEGVTNWAIG